MESTTVGSALSIRQLLAPSAQAAKDHVDNQLDAAVTLRIGISREKVVEAVLGLFDIPLADILIAGWEQYRDVRDAITRTREQPGTVRQVRVGGHTFKSEHHPTLECDVDEVKVFELELELELSLYFTGVVVTIAHGEIISIAPGDATVTSSLKTDKGITLIPEQQLILVFSQPFTKAQPIQHSPTPEARLPFGPAERV